MKQLKLKKEVVERLTSTETGHLQRGGAVLSFGPTDCIVSYLFHCFEQRKDDKYDPTQGVPCKSGNGCDYNSLLYSCRC